MPYTKKFRHLLKSTKKTYGKVKGIKVAFAVARGRGWRI